MTAFEEFGVLPEICRATRQLGFKSEIPTDLDREVIPLILGGGDVFICAPKLRGKTAAFCLPLVQVVWESLCDILGDRARSGTWTPPWRLSYNDRNFFLSITADGLRAQSLILLKNPQGARSTRGVRSGKWGFEAIVASEGHCKVGWSNLNASLNLATDKWGWAYSSTGNKMHKQKIEAYGEKYTAGDILTCLLDIDNAEMRFLKNGVDLGVAFKDFETAEALFPAVALVNCEISLNFGEKPFKVSLPANFLPQIEAPREKKAINTNKLGANPRHPVRLLKKAPQAIIIESSRESAEHTKELINMFKKFLSSPIIRVMLLLGDEPMKNQIFNINNRGADIIITTPTYILDFIPKCDNFLLTHCKFFVLSDADKVIKLGHMGLIERLHKMMSEGTVDGKRLQTIVFSSSLYSSEAKEIQEKLMKFPLCVDLRGDPIVIPNVHQVVVKVDPQQDRSWSDARRHILTDGVHQYDIKWNTSDTADSLSEAVKILKGDYVVKAINEHNMEKAIIFCRTKIDCENLDFFFHDCDRYRYSCVCVHEGQNPNERSASVASFRQNQVNFLICTDVAAKELDFTGLPFIINFTLPEKGSLYCDRIGRAGTEECMGLAISLVSSVPEKVWDHKDYCLSNHSNENPCRNVNLHDNDGCCIWYDEQQCLIDIEEDLNVAIPKASTDMRVPYKEVDGKIIYGQTERRSRSVQCFVPDYLALLEKRAQVMFLKRVFPNAF